MRLRDSTITLLAAHVGMLALLAGCAEGYMSAADLTQTALYTPIPTETSTNTPTQTPKPTKTAFIPVASNTPTELPFTTTPEPTAILITLPTNPQATQVSTIYYTQSGDTLLNVAVRYGVLQEEIFSDVELPSAGLLEPGTMLVIPDVLKNTGPDREIFPDSEVVYSPSAMGFDTAAVVAKADGYLVDYQQYLNTGWADGAEIIDRVAMDNSINPRLLLALVDYRSHWVYGSPATENETKYPIGDINPIYEGLYSQLKWAVSQMSVGYYGWRAGILTSVTLKDGTTIRLAPNLNAGTVAIQNLMSKFAVNRVQWEALIDGLESKYDSMFGSPWLKAFEPLYPTDLTQPVLELPFAPGQTWSFTWGPHSAWGPEGALAALDFAAPAEEKTCSPSEEWVTASAPGLVVRTGLGVIMVDLDGDGHEQTGWNVLYMHVSSLDRVILGTWLNTNDPIGHPSCEGGVASGSHVHIARKFNGEWILADGPVPFVLSGWTAHAGNYPGAGILTKDEQIAEAQPNGSYYTLVKRPATQ